MMPELPEVETVKRTLDPLLRGRTIADFTLHWHRTLEQLTLDLFTASVIGTTITDITRRGKLIVMHIDSGGAITIHLRMTGELLFRPDANSERNAVRETYVRAAFAFTDGGELLFYDTRKFGKIGYRTPEELIALDARLGAEPLETDFTAERLAAILLARRRQIKPLLLDQAIIAGLGNIYVDESLFRSRIHPLQLSSDIDNDRIVALHAAIVDVLSTAVALHGTTLRDYRSGLGEPGENQTRLRVYGLKPGSPCPDCGSPLERLVIGQRGSIFCPNCQPLPGLSDTPRR
jgi:formamidopyrimidine-DNA glycosylase